MLLNAVYLYVLPASELAQVQGSVLDVIADRLLGGAAGNVMGVVSIISLLASISAMTFAGPRVYFAMARDGLFFRRASSVHPRYRTPASAIIAQAMWATLLVLFATADALLTYTGFAIILFSGAAVVAVFVLRAKQPDADRPFKALGYPVAPAIYAHRQRGDPDQRPGSRTRTHRCGRADHRGGIPLYFVFKRRAVSVAG